MVALKICGGIIKEKGSENCFSEQNGWNVHNRLRHRALNKKVGSNYTQDWVQALPAGRSDRI